MQITPQTYPSLFAVGPVVDDVPVEFDAGMPTYTLTDAATMRLESISFFLIVCLVIAFLIRLMWNALRTDFPRLPYLSYVKALGLVALWGLWFLLVLTMISGG